MHEPGETGKPSGMTVAFTVVAVWIGLNVLVAGVLWRARAQALGYSRRTPWRT